MLMLRVQSLKKVLGKLVKVRACSVTLWNNRAKPAFVPVAARQQYAFYDVTGVCRGFSGIIDQHVNRV
jgi:hypothetical protein